MLKSVMRWLRGKGGYASETPVDTVETPMIRTFSAPFDQEHWDEAIKIVNKCVEDDIRDVVWMVALGVQRGKEMEKLNDL